MSTLVPTLSPPVLEFFNSLFLIRMAVEETFLFPGPSLLPVLIRSSSQTEYTVFLCCQQTEDPEPCSDLKQDPEKIKTGYNDKRMLICAGLQVSDLPQIYLCGISGTGSFLKKLRFRLLCEVQVPLSGI